VSSHFGHDFGPNHFSKFGPNPARLNSELGTTAVRGLARFIHEFELSAAFVYFIIAQ